MGAVSKFFIVIFCIVLALVSLGLAFGIGGLVELEDSGNDAGRVTLILAVSLIFMAVSVLAIFLMSRPKYNAWKSIGISLLVLSFLIVPGGPSIDDQEQTAGGEFVLNIVNIVLIVLSLAGTLMFVLWYFLRHRYENRGPDAKGQPWPPIKEMLKNAPGRAAAAFGFIFILTPFIYIFGLPAIQDPMQIFKFMGYFALAVLPFVVLFQYGFVALGKRFGSRLLSVMAWIAIILYVLWAVGLAVFGQTLIDSWTSLAAQEGLTFSDIPTSLIVFFISIILFFIVFEILYGIGQLKIGKHISHAKTAGILNIISGITFIVGIGVIIRSIASLFELITMFDAAKQVTNEMMGPRSPMNE